MIDVDRIYLGIDLTYEFHSWIFCKQFGRHHQFVGIFYNAAIPKQTVINIKAAVIPQLTNHPGGLPKMFWMANISSFWVSGVLGIR
jgi:hypothetical protein